MDSELFCAYINIYDFKDVFVPTRTKSLTWCAYKYIILIACLDTGENYYEKNLSTKQET